MLSSRSFRAISRVAPCAGAWIEIFICLSQSVYNPVAPCAGAWIEIDSGSVDGTKVRSLPVRERGLKSTFAVLEDFQQMSLPVRERGLK